MFVCIAFLNNILTCSPALVNVLPVCTPVYHGMIVPPLDALVNALPVHIPKYHGIMPPPGVLLVSALIILFALCMGIYSTAVLVSYFVMDLCYQEILVISLVV